MAVRGSFAQRPVSYFVGANHLGRCLACAFQSTRIQRVQAIPSVSKSHDLIPPADGESVSQTEHEDTRNDHKRRLCESPEYSDHPERIERHGDRSHKYYYYCSHRGTPLKLCDCPAKAFAYPSAEIHQARKQQLATVKLRTQRLMWVSSKPVTTPVFL